MAEKINNVKIPEVLLEALTVSKEDDDENNPVEPKAYGISYLFTEDPIRKITFIMFFEWMVTTLVYYSLNFSMSNIGTGVFFSNVMSILMDVPAILFLIAILDIWGRKPCVVFGLSLAGISCIFCGFCQAGAIKTTAALIGKFGCSAVFSTIYLYTAEMFPTPIRSTAMGMCSTFARIGGIAAPLAVSLLPKYTFEASPFLLMGGLSVMAGLLALLLPETLGCPLVESTKDINKLYERSKSVWTCWSKKTLTEKRKEII